MRCGALLLLVGCLGKPPRPTGDADNNAPPCTTGGIPDRFDDAATACGAGFQGGVATIARDNGVLHMTPTPNAMDDASCTWTPFPFDSGAFVQVRRALNPDGTYTILQLDTGGEAVGISLDQNNLVMFDNAGAGQLASMPYDQSDMQWWRLRPDGNRISGDYSADGVVWTVLGTSTVTPAPTEANISLNAGAFAMIPDAGTAEFDNFNVCP